MRRRLRRLGINPRHDCHPLQQGGPRPPLYALVLARAGVARTRQARRVPANDKCLMQVNEIYILPIANQMA